MNICPECKEKDGYHKSGCSQWLKEPPYKNCATLQMENIEPRARLDLLEAVAKAAKPFGEYYDCILPEFDDDQYVGEAGFQAHYFRELHAALEAYEAAKG